MDRDLESCDDCGAMFGDRLALKRHVRKCPEMERDLEPPAKKQKIADTGIEYSDTFNTFVCFAEPNRNFIDGHAAWKCGYGRCAGNLFIYLTE